MDLFKQEILRKIENAISDSVEKTSYREYLIASLLRKKVNLEDAILICKDNRLGCNVFDLNFTLALKFGLNIYELFVFNDEDNVKYVIENLDSDAPFSLLNSEIREVLIESTKLVEEIKILMSKKRKFLSDNTSISHLFSDEDRVKIINLLKKSFDCFSMFFHIEILFCLKSDEKFISKFEFALTPNEQNSGLSRRPYIPDDAGIWYDFGKEVTIPFITTGVCRKLSVAYMKEDGRIFEIVNRKSNDHEFYISSEGARFVLEVPEGWFEAHDVSVGDYAKVKAVLRN